jgi:hypothetical protein
MPRRKRDITALSDDDDFDKPTQYHHAGKAQLPSKYGDIITVDPHFDPLPLIPIDNPGPNIPQDIDFSNLETLFQLFFNNKILD